MPQETLRVVARITALPDTIAEVRSCLSALVAPTRKEEGCVSYELLQNLSDPADFTFVEEWASPEALNTHLQSKHIKQAVARVTGLIVEAPDIRSYSLLS